MNRRLLLKLVAAAPACAQHRGKHEQSAQPVPQTPLTMDAVVIDSAGNLAHDLAPADFTITEDGQPRTIDAFAGVNAVSGATRAAPPLPLPMKINPGNVHRTFALVVDDAGIPAARAEAIRSAVAAFAQGLGPRDTAAFFRSSEGSGGLEQLSSDRRPLTSAVARLVSRPAVTAPSSPPWPETLRFVLSGLRGIHGRKAAVVFLNRSPKGANFSSLITLANRAWTSIYAVNLEQDSHPAIKELTDATGGLTISGDPAAALTRIGEDQSAFYLLGFHSETPPGWQDKPVSVKTTRAGDTLRTRRNPPATTPAIGPESGTPDAALRRLLNTPTDGGHLQVRLAARYIRSGKDLLEVQLVADPRDIAITHRLSGTYEGGLDFVIRLYDMSGEIAFDRYLQTSLSMNADQYRQMMNQGLNYTLNVPVDRPGVYQLCAAMLDGTNSGTGLVYRTVEVPDLTTGELSLSGIELKAAIAADHAPAGVNVFHPGQQISYECAVYNVTVNRDTGNSSTVEIRTRIYSGDALIYAGEAQNLTAKNVSNRSLSVRGTLNLAPKIAPGVFTYEITVTDKLASAKKPQTASQWAEFTIR